MFACRTLTPLLVFDAVAEAEATCFWAACHLQCTKFISGDR